MRVVFLDIDGVLNSSKLWERPYNESESPLHMLDEENVARLAKICKTAEAHIVISSSWRLAYGLADIRGYLKAKGLTPEIEHSNVLDKTPYLATRRRSDEIEAWLKGTLNRPESFVILDDDETADVEGRLVKTVFSEGGLLDEHVAKALEMFGVKD
jgi:hypothetical protein